jgi:hypothetical protein
MGRDVRTNEGKRITQRRRERGVDAAAEGREWIESPQRHRDTELQTEAAKRVWMLLIPKARFLRYPPPRVFCKKSLDLVDSKGVDFFGDDKEAASCWKQRG